MASSICGNASGVDIRVETSGTSEELRALLPLVDIVLRAALLVLRVDRAEGEGDTEARHALRAPR